MDDERIQQQLKPCVSETVDEQGFEVTCTLYADHDSFHIGLHGVVWADPVTEHGRAPLAGYPVTSPRPCGFCAETIRNGEWCSMACKQRSEGTLKPLACADCGTPYSSDAWIDFHVDDALWLQISPTGHHGGVLCVGCAGVRLKKLGASVIHVTVDQTDRIQGTLKSCAYWTSDGSEPPPCRKCEMCFAAEPAMDANPDYCACDQEGMCQPCVDHRAGFPEGTLSTYSICSAHREPDPDCPRCKVTISGGGLSPSDGDCRNGYADDPTSCTFADVCCRTHGHVEGCKGECREDAPERCPHGRYAALGNCVACKVDAPEGRLSPSPGGCPCCGKRPGSLADDCFCNAMRVDRDELRSALRGMVRARVEGEPAYRKAITVLADIAGREEAAKADLQDGL